MSLCSREASCHCTLGQSQLEHGKSGQLVCMRKVAVSVKRKTWILFLDSSLVQRRRLVIERSRVRVPAGAVGEFSSAG